MVPPPGVALLGARLEVDADRGGVGAAGAVEDVGHARQHRGRLVAGEAVHRGAAGVAEEQPRRHRLASS